MKRFSIGTAVLLGTLLSSTAFAAPCDSLIAQNRGNYQPGQSGDVAQNRNNYQPGQSGDVAQNTATKAIELACR
jgi:hypothetical protein